MTSETGCHQILFIYEAVAWSRSFQTSACELLAYRNFFDPYCPTSLALLWVISRRSFFEGQIVDEAGGCKWVHNVAISSWKFMKFSRQLGVSSTSASLFLMLWVQAQYHQSIAAVE
ncbi:hypothetical protein B0H11DRAFT_1916442 [Mycena galericulata]|nr:hypothetical protein B0H11DRAFT_1916442 [Mycena galericulata]